LGHVLNAIYVWGFTRSRGGRVLLRIEDHDRSRSRPHFETAILRDLDWLGFAPDEPPVRQSDRYAIYERALDRLRAEGRVYACACSRTDIAGSNPGPTEQRYPGTCSTRALPETPGRGIRIRLEPSIERFVDLRHGVEEQRPSAQCGDLLARDRDGHWTYQFAVTVDDDAQGVTVVIRGDDLLASAGRQMQLARLLGRVTPPLFLHHPLIMKTHEQKISKSDGDSGVPGLREQGWSAAEIIGRAAYVGGLTDKRGALGAADVPSLFG
jgi:glutamyl-tRNA synthetase/glutamyl-Q tRNA(Asp) synthetase